MATGLIDIIKRASIDANESELPVDLKYGIVRKEDPLEIMISPVFILTEAFLIIPEYLTDRFIEVSVPDWETEEVDDHVHTNTDPAGKHLHEITGDKYLWVYNRLRVGDKVALLREHGGEKYLILDRVAYGR